MRPSSVRAAQYVRMSTEHQKYSIAYQSACNQAFALERGYELVRTFTDAGQSGLTLNRRNGLKSLLAEVLGGEADFQVVVVYDVSRWGRFQDPDESAHYEYICRAAGVAVEYAAEPFANDGSLTSTLVKHLKRAMAAEYSRELSAKVARSKRGLSKEGYWCGGRAVYGLRRCILEADGSPGRVLERGEYKAIQGARCVLVAGPPHEVETVRRIFRQFVVDGLSTRSIARQLNAEGSTGNLGAPWTRGAVERILNDEKYTGVLVTGRLQHHLHGKTVLPREAWTRVPGACPTLVDPDLFQIARANLRRALRAGSDQRLLDTLRQALRVHGRLSARVLRNDPSTPSPSTYVKRFGSLMRAYQLIGYRPSRQQETMTQLMSRAGSPAAPLPSQLSDPELIARLAALHARTGRMTSELINADEDLPSADYLRRRLGGILRICELVGCTPTDRQVRAWRSNQRRTPKPSAWPSGLLRRRFDLERFVETNW